MDVSSPSYLLDALNDSPDKGNVDHIYKICDVLIKQLSDVTDALENERAQRIRAEEERDKIKAEKDRYHKMCKLAGEQISVDKIFILEALEKAVERERKISELNRNQQNDEQPTSQLARLAEVERISLLLKKSKSKSMQDSTEVPTYIPNDTVEKKKPLTRLLTDIDPNTRTVSKKRVNIQTGTSFMKSKVFK